MEWIMIMIASALMPLVLKHGQELLSELSRRIRSWLFGVGSGSHIKVSQMITNRYNWKSKNPNYAAVEAYVVANGQCIVQVDAEIDDLMELRFQPSANEFNLKWNHSSVSGMVVPIRVIRNQMPRPDDLDASKQTIDRHFILTTSWEGSEEEKRCILEAFVKHCLELQQRQKKFVNRVSFGKDNPIELTRAVREGVSMEGLLMEKSVREGLKADLEYFWAGKDRYARQNRLWKRGYLFSGPPGCGKSTLVRTLTELFDMNLMIVNLRDFLVDKDFMTATLDFGQKVGRKCFLFEDVDCYTKLHQRQPGPKLNAETSKGGPEGQKGQLEENNVKPVQDDSAVLGVGLETLLNFLDGVVSPSESIFVLTSNHHEKLDAALLRPGRVDYHLRMGPCSDPAEIARFGARFLEDFAAEKELLRFARDVAVPESMTVAEIGSLLQHRLSTGLPFRELADRVLKDRIPNVDQTQEPQMDAPCKRSTTL